MSTVAQPEAREDSHAHVPPIESAQMARRAFRLLISLVFLILVHPLAGERPWHARLLGLLTLLPLVLAAFAMHRSPKLRMIALLGMAMAIVIAVPAELTHNRMLFAAQWTVLTIAFGSVVAGLFSFLQGARRIHKVHLYVASSIYLLLAVLFFCIYSAVTAMNPNAFVGTASSPTQAAAGLLYFSLVTLTTLGYGDIIPVAGFVRMLAALEAATGVLYVAITISILVSGYTGRARNEQ